MKNFVTYPSGIVLFFCSLFILMLPATVMTLHTNDDRTDFSWGEETYRKYDLNYRIVQVTLFPPLSTNGLHSVNYASRYSLNIIAGYNGGLNEGYELGLVNINRYYTHARFQLGALNATGGQHAGFNIAGFGNISTGPMLGAQLSGLGNVTRESMKGIQLSGVANLSGKHSKGLQFTGIMNFAGGSIQGMQFAGIGNVSGGETQGIQVAGIGNFSLDEIQGIQVAGIGNFSLDEIQGIQVSGVGNFSLKEMQGVQVAGVGNLSLNDAQGIQVGGVANANYGDSQGILISGVANVSTGFGQGIYVSGVTNVARSFDGIAMAGSVNLAQNSMRGIQIAGLFNFSNDAKGVQIAPFNTARKFEGVPVGLVSLYGNGRKQLDVWADETGFVYGGFKTGTHRVYNTIAVGHNPHLTGRDVYSISWSIGYTQPLDEAWEKERFRNYLLIRDFTFKSVQDDDWFDGDMSLSYSYRHMFGRQIGRGVMLYAGPTLNMLVSRSDAIGDFYPYSIFDTAKGDLQYRFWIGGSLGVQLF